MKHTTPGMMEAKDFVITLCSAYIIYFYIHLAVLVGIHEIEYSLAHVHYIVVYKEWISIGSLGQTYYSQYVRRYKTYTLPESDS